VVASGAKVTYKERTHQGQREQCLPSVNTTIEFPVDTAGWRKPSIADAVGRRDAAIDLREEEVRR
jgi:hypothetical protein